MGERIFLKLLLWVKPCSRCFTALICQILPPFVAFCTPSQHPKGTNHLATIVHDLGPQLWAGRFLQEALLKSHFIDEDAGAPGG